MNSVSPSLAAAVDQMEATMQTVRRLTEANRLLADPQVGDPYIIESLALNVHGQWTEVDHERLDRELVHPGSVPRVTRADHVEEIRGWELEAHTVLVPGVNEVTPPTNRGRFRPAFDFCGRCKNPLHPEHAARRPYRVLWVGKGVYIAEFHFCEEVCVPYFERILPTVKWEDRPHAV